MPKYDAIAPSAGQFRSDIGGECRLKCCGLSEADKLSNDGIATAPNSDVNEPLFFGPTLPAREKRHCGTLSMLLFQSGQSARVLLSPTGMFGSATVMGRQTGVLLYGKLGGPFSFVSQPEPPEYGP